MIQIDRYTSFITLCRRRPSALVTITVKALRHSWPLEKCIEWSLYLLAFYLVHGIDGQLVAVAV